ncbi:MAG: glycosyltransferase family 39 protein [Burkholderiales bacterium]|nr:glycosyltransferase family 39 protein [Burkholderiales bacterium]
MPAKHYFHQWQIKLLIVIIVGINFCGIFNPLIRNDDPALYANIAKHIVLSHDWLNLIFNNSDWLDKPHFPFWITAVFFKIFGISSFAYILPGFLFHIIGGFYTYKLGRKLYASKDVGLIAALLYFSSLHLLISAIDVRAEAYLLGSIIPACYYWWQYHSCDNKLLINKLVKGAFFTALALMTKGLFVLITIFSGLIIVWLKTAKLKNLIKLKWILAFCLSLVFITPELIALYVQFDLHPEKIVFGHQGISGIKWFFWGSQFGRFFADGPIIINHIQPWHYLYFIHTFLWAFLPWSIIFYYLLGLKLKLIFTRFNINNNEHIAALYLLGSFIPTFVLFSITTFQLDHYTNIIMPFAAILCAQWFAKFRNSEQYKLKHPLFYFQIALAFLLTAIIIGLSLFIFDSQWLSLILVVGLIGITLYVYFWYKDNLIKALLYPVLTTGLLFVFLIGVNTIAIKYDLGYQSATLINKYNNNYPVVDYADNSLTLQFYSQHRYLHINTNQLLQQLNRPYYLVIKQQQLPQIGISNYVQLTNIEATTIDKVIVNLLNPKQLNNATTSYAVVLVK